MPHVWAAEVPASQAAPIYKKLGYSDAEMAAMGLAPAAGPPGPEAGAGANALSLDDGRDCLEQARAQTKGTRTNWRQSTAE